jgi:hypothetical protein
MSNPKNNADASASEAIAVLESKIIVFSRQQADCADRIKKLILTEDPTRGIVFAKEIFTLQQEKLRLEVEVQILRNKINRMREFGLS